MPCHAFFPRGSVGSGLSREQQARLFQAFAQADASITRTHGGTGLGLAIAQRLIGLMGGEIHVASEPGRGSDFHFTLAFSGADVAPEVPLSASSVTQEITKTLQDRHVLVVGETAATYGLIESLLGHHGASSRGVASVAAAKDAARRQYTDLVVLSDRLLDAGGTEFARSLRVPVVLLRSGTAPVDASQPNPFAATITKPIRNLSFVATLATALLGERTLAPDATKTASVESDPLFADGHPLRILVVDDHPVNLKLITVMLQRLGYMPSPFDNAAAALKRLREEKHDLIFMDVQMPELDGLTATRRLRAGIFGELNRDSRIVALTAGATAEERAACLAAGMDDVLTKPVARGELLETLADAARSPTAA